MKKLFLCVLILSAVLMSSLSYAGMVRYETYFETAELRNDWSTWEGSWDFIPYTNPAVLGHNLYLGNHNVDTMETGIAYFNENTNIVTTNLSMRTSFGIPSEGVYSGFYFGSHVNNNVRDRYSMGLGVDGNVIFLYSDLGNGESNLAIGNIVDGDEALLLSMSIDENNYLSWYVAKKNNNIWGTSASAWGSISTQLEIYEGSLGLWSDNGLTGFGYFDMQYDDGSPVPVPAAIWLFASGLLGLAGLRRRQK